MRCLLVHVQLGWTSSSESISPPSADRDHLHTRFRPRLLADCSRTFPRLHDTSYRKHHLVQEWKACASFFRILPSSHGAFRPRIHGQRSCRHTGPLAYLSLWRLSSYRFVESFTSCPQDRDTSIDAISDQIMTWGSSFLSQGLLSGTWSSSASECVLNRVFTSPPDDSYLY